MRPRWAHPVPLGLALVWPLAMAALYFTRKPGEGEVDPVAQTLYTLGKVVQFGGVALWVWWASRSAQASGGRKPPDSFREESIRGLTPPARHGLSLALGGAFAMVVSALIVGGYFLLVRGSPLAGNAPAVIREKLAGFGITTPARFLALAVFLSLAHSALEEWYWRWFAHGGLRSWLGAWALPVSSAGFAAHHVLLLAVYLPDRLWLAALLGAGVGLGGAVWAWVYDRTGSLVGPWVSHAIIDAALMLVGFDLLFG